MRASLIVCLAILLSACAPSKGGGLDQKVAYTPFDDGHIRCDQ